MLGLWYPSTHFDFLQGATKTLIKCESILEILRIFFMPTEHFGKFKDFFFMAAGLLRFYNMVSYEIPKQLSSYL